MFKLWSDNNAEARKVLRPDFGIRAWDELSPRDKDVMWQNFLKKHWFKNDAHTHTAVDALNENNKARALCNHTLGHGGPHYHEMRGVRHGIKNCCFDAAQIDFQHIFHQEHQDVVYELFSYYAGALQNERIYKENFVNFKNMFNDISHQFGLNILMVKNSIVPKQEEKITKEVYEPVLNYLAEPKWGKINNELSDAFTDYLKNTPQGYSGCVTKTVSAIEAFLQILVEGKNGGKKLSKLISEAQKKNLIPNDVFSQTIFKNIDGIFARERKETGDAHPKSEYANEKNARLVLNLAMVFIQHCIQE